MSDLQPLPVAEALEHADGCIQDACYDTTYDTRARLTLKLLGDVWDERRIDVAPRLGKRRHDQSKSTRALLEAEQPPSGAGENE